MSSDPDVSKAEVFELSDLDLSELASKSSLLILPREKAIVEDERKFIYEDQAATIRKLLEADDVPVDFASNKKESKFAVEQSIDLGVPSLLILYGLWRENKDVIKLAFRKVADYYIQRGQRTMEVEYPVLLPNGSVEKVRFEGHPDDMPEKISSALDELDVEEE